MGYRTGVGASPGGWNTRARGGFLWLGWVGLLLWVGSASLAQGTEGRSNDARPEAPPSTPMPEASVEPEVSAEPEESTETEPAASNGKEADREDADGEEADSEEPETVMVSTDEAINLTYSQHSDRRPAFSPDGQWIAFETDRDGQWEIYRMRTDGSRQERLTRDPADDRSPSFSPDGRYLAFQSNRKPGDRRSDLYLLDLELGETHVISDDDADEAFPRFSPDGQWLLYTASPGGNTDLYRLPLGGTPPVAGAPERLTEHEGNDVWGVFAPDGQSIVFFSRRDGDQDDLYRLDLASRDIERLTEHPANDFVPAVSPNGRWIAFASNRRGAGETRTFLLDLEGEYSLFELDETYWTGEPTFSPDGSLLAMVSGRTRNYEIFLWQIPTQ